MDTDGLDLQYQGISSYSTEYSAMHFQLFMGQWTACMKPLKVKYSAGSFSLEVANSILHYLPLMGSPVMQYICSQYERFLLIII